jgi:hypothetical protein
MLQNTKDRHATRYTHSASVVGKESKKVKPSHNTYIEA